MRDGTLFGVAGRKYAIGLLWPALFRAEDVALVTIPAENEDEEDEARESQGPIVERAVALGRLAASRRWYAEAFASFGSLEAHFDLFEATLCAVPGEYLTMDVDEIATMVDPDDYWDEVDAMLESLDEPPTEHAAQHLLKLSGYPVGEPFAPARGFVDRIALGFSEQQSLAAIFGYGEVNDSARAAWEAPLPPR